MPRTKQTVVSHFGGWVAPGFERVEYAFRRNFSSGRESAGASFAVYYRGKKVVDIWGGYKHSSTKEPWEKDTLCMAWSVTKAVSAVCIALLNERGDLDYSRPVCHYWPEFAENGKQSITVGQLVSHQAGLPLVEGEKVTWALARDHNRISRLLAKQKPVWKPGSRHGYHAWTMGWYMDQLIRRCDPKHRSMGKFFADEIAKPYNLDFRVGTPLEHENRVAHMEDAKLGGIKYMMFHNPEEFWHLLCQILNPVSLLKKTVTIAGELDGIDTANTAAYHQLELPQCNGIGTARALAKLFGILANQGVDAETGQRLLTEKTCDKFRIPVSVGLDQVYKLPKLFAKMTYGMEITSADDHEIYGHPGYGGQAAYADPKLKLGWAYLTSKIAIYGSPMEDPRYARLRNALYTCVRDLQMDCVSINNVDV